MNYKPNTWVNFDGYVSLVVDVWQGYYEPFDAEVVDGEKRCGQRRYRQIVLRDLFDDYGRRLAGVPAMKYLEAIADYLQPSNEEDQRRIDRFRTAHPDEYRHWMERDATCTDYVTVGIAVPPEEQKATLAKMRKLSRNLPPTFSYRELVSFADKAGISLQGCCDEYASRYENHICFELCFRVGEQRNRQQLYFAVKHFDHRDSAEDTRLLSDPSCWFNFEHLFLFTARNAKEYLALHPDPSLQKLLKEMKPAFTVLINSKHQGNPLANEFFRWVPKRMFSREEVWKAAAEYLDLLADRYATAPVAEALRTPEWQHKYNWIYDVCS